MHTALAIEGRLRVEQRATPALVAYAQLLAATTRDIDRFVEQELAGNPALERLAPAGGSVPGFHVGCELPEAADEPALLEHVLEVVRALAPVGVACRDVVHCLDVQLQRLADEPELVALARRILAEGLADLAAGRYGALGRRVGADRDAVVAARDLIRERTRPYPVLDRPLRHGVREPVPAPDVVISVSPEDPAVLVVALAEEQRCAEPRRARRSAGRMP